MFQENNLIRDGRKDKAYALSKDKIAMAVGKYEGLSCHLYLRHLRYDFV